MSPKPNEAGGEAPAMVVDVPVGGAPAGEALGAVDAILGGDMLDVGVRLLVEPDHPGRAALEELCDVDERVRLEAPDAGPPECEIHAVMPPTARPRERTLVEIRRLIAENGAAAVVVPVPGRLRLLERAGFTSRLPGIACLRASRARGDGGIRRVGYRSVELGSTRVPHVVTLPPDGELSAERSEHLRHRARAATNRSRVEQNAQRLARERMRIGHERARAELLDRRIAASGPRYWLSWRVRRTGAVLSGIALRPWRLAKRVPGLIRRFRRKAVDRVRRLRSPAPKAQRHRPGTD